MKITIISYDNWGFNDYLVDFLKQNNHEVKHIDFSKFKYKYPNIFFKVYNFFLKIIAKKDLKRIFYGKKIIAELIPNQDIILTIKGDFIDPKYLKEIKKYTNVSVGFFNDSYAKCPKIKNVLNCFDEVYSFEKNDCKKFNLKFATNWIYKQSNKNEIHNHSYDVFNISSKDRRYPIILNIAKNLLKNNIKSKILIHDKKNETNDDGIEVITNKLSLNEVYQLIDKSRALLDINRPKQNGLTFRVFESLGTNKKLITTNSDIINYDFYDERNILIIDEKNPEIPSSFFKNAYVEVPNEVYKKYTIAGWVENVILSNIKK